MEINILKMEQKHIEQICEIEKECFVHPWSYKSLFDELSNPNAYFLCAIKSNYVVGYIGMYCILSEGYITNIAVSKKYQHQGIGKKLLEAICDYSQKRNFDFITLEVRESNKIAIGLYEYFNFKLVGRRKNFYSEPREDALLLKLNFI